MKERKCRTFDHNTEWTDVADMTLDEAINVLSRTANSKDEDWEARPHMARAAQMAIAAMQFLKASTEYRIDTMLTSITKPSDIIHLFIQGGLQEVDKDLVIISLKDFINDVKQGYWEDYKEKAHLVIYGYTSRGVEFGENVVRFPNNFVLSFEFILEMLGDDAQIAWYV